MDHPETHESAKMTWLVISLIVAFILAKGAFSFWVVGDPQYDGWDLRPVRDIPGESAYAIYETLPTSQHVRGKEGE